MLSGQRLSLDNLADPILGSQAIIVNDKPPRTDKDTLLELFILHTTCLEADMGDLTIDISMASLICFRD